MAPGPPRGREPDSDHPVGRPEPRQRGSRDRDRAAVRGRCELRRGERARPQGPGEGAPLPGRGEASGMTAPRRRALPDEAGHFGRYGGRFVPETLMAPLVDLTKAYVAARRDGRFRAELAALLRDYAGRP